MPPRTIPVQLEIENVWPLDELLEIRDKFHSGHDLYWLFSPGHAKITELVLDNLSCFKNPIQILRINQHFTKAYTNTVNASPSLVWRNAFESCKDLEDRLARNPFLLGEVEHCGALIAHVDIDVDLRQALNVEGDMGGQNFSNVLALIYQTQLSATLELRGVFGFYKLPVVEILGPYRAFQSNIGAIWSSPK